MEAIDDFEYGTMMKSTLPPTHHKSQHDLGIPFFSGSDSTDGKYFARHDMGSIESSDTKSDCTTADEKSSKQPTAVLESDGPTTPKKNVKIKYTLEFFNAYNRQTKYISQDDTPLDLSRVMPTQQTAPSDDDPPIIFEIITQADGHDKRYKPNSASRDSSTISRERSRSREMRRRGVTSKPLKLEDVTVTKVSEVRMEIHSQSLLNAIRQVVDYYPGQNLTGDVVIIHEPFGVIIHHRRELQELLEDISSTSETNQSTQLETAEHLKILFDFIKPYIDKILPPIERLLRNKVPTVTFDNIWYILKPGTFVYFKLGGEWIGGVVMHIRRDKNPREPRVKVYYEDQRDTPSQDIDRWDIEIWYLDLSNKLFRTSTHAPREPGQDRRVRRDYEPELINKNFISQFEGEKDVTALQIVPREYWDTFDNGARSAQFEARGAKKIELMATKFRQVSHKGDTLDEKSIVYQGQVVLDNRQDLEVTGLANSIWWWNSPPGLLDDIWLNEKGKVSVQRISKLARLLEPRDKVLDKITNEQAWLMSPNLMCFALEIKSWCCVHIDRVSTLEQSRAPMKLVIEDSHLKMIKALTASQIGTATTSWAADSIKNKGQGVIILLHGQPGVGKTYSVECTAAEIDRPLLALTIADIGTQERNIETELTSWFYLAERWKAVLLIDEADIFLERRKHTDLARNGIVSAFLRKMEYFSGLLFLTTNRVGLIDEAFMSRVHLVVGFPPFDDSKRCKVWEGFFTKMSNETKGSIRVASSAKEYVMQNSSKLEIELNGREIRNVLQTAISLAEYEAKAEEYYKEGDHITVTKGHFESVLEMSRAFKAYIDRIKNDTAKLRAKNYYGRNDEDGEDVELDKSYK